LGDQQNFQDSFHDILEILNTNDFQVESDVDSSAVSAFVNWVESAESFPGPRQKCVILNDFEQASPGSISGARIGHFMIDIAVKSLKTEFSSEHGILLFKIRGE
jgi:hypothetical protein